MANVFFLLKCGSRTFSISLETLLTYPNSNLTAGLLSAGPGKEVTLYQDFDEDIMAIICRSLKFPNSLNWSDLKRSEVNLIYFYSYSMGLFHLVDAADNYINTLKNRNIMLIKAIETLWEHYSVELKENNNKFYTLFYNLACAAHELLRENDGSSDIKGRSGTGDDKDSKDSKDGKGNINSTDDNNNNNDNNNDNNNNSNSNNNNSNNNNNNNNNSNNKDGKDNMNNINKSNRSKKSTGYLDRDRKRSTKSNDKNDGHNNTSDDESDDNSCSDSSCECNNPKKTFTQNTNKDGKGIDKDNKHENKDGKDIGKDSKNVDNKDNKDSKDNKDNKDSNNSNKSNNSNNSDDNNSSDTSDDDVSFNTDLVRLGATLHKIIVEKQMKIVYKHKDIGDAFFSMINRWRNCGVGTGPKITEKGGSKITEKERDLKEFKMKCLEDEDKNLTCSWKRISQIPSHTECCDAVPAAQQEFFKIFEVEEERIDPNDTIYVL